MALVPLLRHKLTAEVRSSGRPVQQFTFHAYVPTHINYTRIVRG